MSPLPRMYLAPVDSDNASYYCCRCNFGPMMIALYPACINCSHVRDSSCVTRATAANHRLENEGKVSLKHGCGRHSVGSSWYVSLDDVESGYTVLKFDQETDLDGIIQRSDDMDFSVVKLSFENWRRSLLVHGL
ncbi:hypothetical protein BC567DRAFT_27916 [Phyllosticta citribraziliensis]